MSRKTRKDDPADADVQGLPWWRRPGRGAALACLTLVGLVIVAGAGLEQLRSRVSSLPEYNPTPKLLLVDVPEWVDREGWRPQVLASIRLPDQPDWLGGGLVRDIGEQLQRSGWVSKVKRVSQDVDGSIRIACDYRRPIAMVRTRELDRGVHEYVAIDSEGVRLPQVYLNARDAGWLEIIGVEAAVPDPGQPFVGDDARAAADLAQVIDKQKFEDRTRVVAEQICVIDVSNFHGRKDKRRNQILLYGRGSGDPIKWGSPIGEEFEEPSWQEKIRLITAVLEDGAPHVQADISCYPNRVIMRSQPAIATVDGSQTRDR